MSDDKYDTIEISMRVVGKTPEGIATEWRHNGKVDRDFVPRSSLIGHARKKHPDATDDELAAAVDRYLAEAL